MEKQMYTITELETKHMTKGEAFAWLKEDKNHEFDYALPQDWLDEFSAFCAKYAPNATYDLIRSTTVWVYPESAPLTICKEVDKAIDLYAAAIVTKRGL